MTASAHAVEALANTPDAIDVGSPRRTREELEGLAACLKVIASIGFCLLPVFPITGGTCLANGNCDSQILRGTGIISSVGLAIILGALGYALYVGRCSNRRNYTRLP